MLTDKARTNTLVSKCTFGFLLILLARVLFGMNLDKLAPDVGDLFGLLVNGQRAVTVHIEQVLTDQVLVVDEGRAADHLLGQRMYQVISGLSHLCQVIAEVDEGVEAGDDGDQVDEEGEQAAEEGQDERVPCCMPT